MIENHIQSIRGAVEPSPNDKSTRFLTETQSPYSPKSNKKRFPSLIFLNVVRAFGTESDIKKRRKKDSTLLLLSQFLSFQSAADLVNSYIHNGIIGPKSTSIFSDVTCILLIKFYATQTYNAIF